MRRRSIYTIGIEERIKHDTLALRAFAVFSVFAVVALSMLVVWAVWESL